MATIRVFTIFTVQPLYDNPEAGRATFFQGSIIATDDDDTLNLGLGQRWILNDGKVIAGLNLFYDNEWDAGHERMSVGGEVLTSVGDFRVNSYTALSDTETVNGAEETALDGMDMELAVPLGICQIPEFMPKASNGKARTALMTWKATQFACALLCLWVLNWKPAAPLMTIMQPMTLTLFHSHLMSPAFTSNNMCSSRSCYQIKPMR